MRLFATLILLSIAANAPAAIYKWVKPDGSVIYSDRPPTESATPADLPPVQEIKMPPPPPPPEPSSSNQAAQAQPAEEYTKLEITEPANNSTVRDNGGQVSVKLSLEPQLQEGDVTTILLDGNEIGQGRGTSLTLTNVDRGTHTLQAAVKDAQGTTLISSPTITFTVQRVSVIHR